LLLFASFFAGMLQFGLDSPYAFVPVGVVFLVHAIHASYLIRFRRPCGHMRLTQGGRLGFHTLFIHRTCPMCGDRIEDAPGSYVKAR
jgi:hypothetical protein